MRRSTAGQYGALVLPARERGRFSEASLKELGRAGGAENKPDTRKVAAAPEKTETVSQW